VARDEEILRFGPVTMAVRAPAEASGGAFSLLEELPPLADTPAHVHAKEDEYFHILEGEHVVTVGDEEHRLGPGQGIFAPRGIPHAQRRVDPGAGRLLVLCTPGGLEGFFRRLASADTDGTLGPEAYASASEEFGITWV
jgi:mannose-6-phosphate isomerase-like protein (cupin superfamily)